VTAESMWVSGAYSAAGLAGNSDGTMVGGGAGIAAVGGGYGAPYPSPIDPVTHKPYPNPSHSSSHTAGVGVGVGGGGIGGNCATTVLSCSN